MEIIGQKRLLDKINSYTIYDLPKNILLLGETGCGKHLLSQYIANKYMLNYIEINEDITNDSIVEFQQNPIKTLYVINLDKFNEKKQNQFLKFIEEPSTFVYIILTASSELNIIPTILNRCIIYHFDMYSIEELKNMSVNLNVTNELAYTFCTTPGQLLNITDEIINNTINICTVILNKLSEMKYSNALALSKEINLSDNYDRIDLNLFLKILSYLSFNKYLKENNIIAYKIYMSVQKYRQVLYNKKESYFLNFITFIWNEVHNN